MKIKVNDTWMAAAAQIAAAQIQNDPEKGKQENLCRTIQEAYMEIWRAAEGLQNG